MNVKMITTVLLILLFLSESYIKCEILLNSENSKSDENPIVSLPNGLIRGQKREYFIAFEGIPYAEPPIDDNRFEPPIPYERSWVGIRNTTSPGNECMQWNPFKSGEDKIQGFEDCLYLNVYTNNLNGSNPVVFWIHSGAFMYGYGDLYEPKALLERSIVVVNFNYRVGSLGFLSMQDHELPGNMGLKDQNIALKWVQRNIDKFGGDSNKITIAGFSAGGASVHLHYMSPLSRGLFQNGISHSGVALNPWVFPAKPVQRAQKVANKLGCYDESTQIIKSCLKTKPADEIVRSARLFQKFLSNPFTIFGPVVEPESPTAFITRSPEEYLESGDIEKLPWLVTFVKDEGIYTAGEFMGKSEYVPEINDRWLEVAPHILDYNDTVPTEKLGETSAAIRTFYFDDLEINNETFPRIIKVFLGFILKINLI